PCQFYQLAKESCATLTALVPTQVHDLVNKHLQAPPSIRATIVGGGVLTSSLYEKAQQLGWKLLPSYGLTECASQVATAKHGQYDEAKILSHVTLRIDTQGFICIKSDSLLTVYGENSRFFDPKVEGWFTTEDKGELCGDALKVFGRASDFVKIGGESVNILHLQKVLEELKISLQIPQNVVIVAVRDDRLGHAIHFVVEGKKNPQIEKLIEAYQEKVMPYERARETHYVKEIPRTPLGKIQKGHTA
ncbi:MAG: AMP-binding protein, partial [Waddliaceae bacterium]